MKKILFIFLILPFSVFAELSPSDLEGIENKIQSIKDSTLGIETDVDYFIKRFDPLVGYVYQILRQNDGAEDTRLRIESTLNSLKTYVQILETDVHTVLPSLDSNLQSVSSTLQTCQIHLYNIENTTSHIYEELSKLGTIPDDVLAIRKDVREILYLLNNRFDSLESWVFEIFLLVDNINGQTGQVISTLSELKNYISSITKNTTSSLYYITDSTLFSADKNPNYGIATLIITGTNYYQTAISYLDSLLSSQTYFSQTSYFSTRQNYVIISNLQESVSIQKDISTNVAYIASVITNSHDLLKLIASNVVNIARHTMPTNIADQYETEQQKQMDQISSSYQDHENDMQQYESQLTHLPRSVQNRFDDSLDYLSKLSSSNLSVDRLDDEIFASLPEYHSSLANMSFSLPIDIQLTPDVKQIFGILRKCVTTTIWIFTFLFTLFMIQKFLQFVSWIMSLLNPITRDVFGNTSSGSLYRLMGG